MRFQVRKRQGQWETWIFLGRSWRLIDRYYSFDLAMTMATGQAPYRTDSPWTRGFELVWMGR